MVLFWGHRGDAWLRNACIKNVVGPTHINILLADRTNGRAYATVLRPSSVVVVCDVMYCG